MTTIILLFCDQFTSICVDRYKRGIPPKHKYLLEGGPLVEQDSPPQLSECSRNPFASVHLPAGGGVVFGFREFF